MELDQPPSDHELKGRCDHHLLLTNCRANFCQSQIDWLLYWQPDKIPDQRTRAQDHKPTSASEGNHTTNAHFPSTSAISPSPTATETTFSAQPTLESASTPLPKSPFRYWPHVAFLGLLIQILIFAFQFSYYRSVGLPLLANWRSIWAIAFPANTCLYLKALHQAAPLKWPGLMRRQYARWGLWAVYGIWGVWSLGIWWEMKGWGEDGV